MARRYKIGVIRGDGIGPEIVSATLKILSYLDLNLEFVDLEAGYEYYRKHGKPVEEGFFDKVRELDAVLKGPLYTPPGDKEFGSLNVLIRRELGLYANVRPFKSLKGISAKEFNFVIVRENTEDVYVGIEGLYGDYAVALRIISKQATEKVVNFAINLAKLRGFNKVTVVHKANILKLTDGLFREVFYSVVSRHHDIVPSELIVDAAAYTIVKNPENLQVLVTPNLYGDILSDLAAGMVGSLGLCGSAQVGDAVAVFEPVHGTALDIAGKGIANPLGEIVAAKMMLEYLFEKFGDGALSKRALVLERAVNTLIENRKVLTPDLGGDRGTEDVVNALKEIIKKNLHVQ